jgi:hypothetical protein
MPCPSGRVDPSSLGTWKLELVLQRLHHSWRATVSGDSPGYRALCPVTVRAAAAIKLAESSSGAKACLPASPERSQLKMAVVGRRLKQPANLKLVDSLDLSRVCCTVRAFGTYVRHRVLDPGPARDCVVSVTDGSVYSKKASGAAIALKLAY